MNNYEEAAEYIRSHMRNIKPEVAVILGSGLGCLAEEFTDSTVLDYKDIPGFPISTVVGHAGQLIIGMLNGKSTIAMNGRFHFYEGYEISKTTMAVRVFALLGIKTLIITNAAGGINTDFAEGGFMIIKDHINFSGVSPLRGPNLEEFGTRFPDMTDVYDTDLSAKLAKIMGNHKVFYRDGVYAYLQGPSFETPAEIRALRTLGADAVGMSTVPEAIVARHCGMKVVAVSCITNMAAGIKDIKLSHEDVSRTANMVKEVFKSFMKEFITSI